MSAVESIDLSGSWSVRLDREHRGCHERWHAAVLDTPLALPLPGSLPLAGIGDPVGPDTPWTGSLFDRSLFTDPRYAHVVLEF